MQQIKQLIKEIRYKKYIKSIKLKSVLVIIKSVFFITFVYSLINIIYLEANEQYVKTYISNLLVEIEKNYDHIEEQKDRIKENLNLNIYRIDSVENLLIQIPSSIEKEKVLSASDIRQLNNGHTVINKVNTRDQALSLLIFIYPIIENNNQLKELLFVHVPYDSVKVGKVISSKLSIVVAILSVGITIIISWKIFGKSYHQLKKIKLGVIEISKGNLDTKLFQNSNDEVGEITEAFNVMSTKLKNEQSRTKEFIEDFSHEIKTPLSLIKNYNQAMMDNMIQDSEEQQRCYRLIEKETNRIHKLIQSYLDFAKLDTQLVEIVKHPIVFAQIIEDIISKYGIIFEENNVKLDMRLDYDVIISADEDRLEQIIQNIIQNAIRYSKDKTCISIKMENKENTCVLTISDNGIGISEEDLAIITNRFIRVNKVYSRKETGTGLGLSIVEKLMKLHNGKMDIESQLGIGTTIKLEFPIISD